MRGSYDSVGSLDSMQFSAGVDVEGYCTYGERIVGCGCGCCGREIEGYLSDTLKKILISG